MSFRQRFVFATIGMAVMALCAAMISRIVPEGRHIYQDPLGAWFAGKFLLGSIILGLSLWPQRDPRLVRRRI